MSPTTRRILSSERGAVFVQVGIAVFVLFSFMAFVLDYGIMWTSRRQAQNAADAGALAGAFGRGYDDFDDPPLSGGAAAQAARLVANANLVWQQPGQAVVSFACPAGTTGRCVRVDVYRNGQFGSTPLPTVFGPLLSVTSQGVRATATALSGNGNALDCLRPLAIPDEWVENRTPSDEFNRWSATGTLLSPADAYIPPSATQAVSYNLSHFGERIFFGYDQAPTGPITAGEFSSDPALMLSLTLPGTNTYEQNITGCNGQPVALHDQLPVVTPVAGTTRTALEALIAQDAGADWDYIDNEVENSCAPACAPVSPRLIAIALYDPDRYQLERATGWPGCGGAPCIRVSNIIGFFIHRWDASGGHGHFVRYPGTTIATAPTFVDEGSWLVTTTLIR
jgi:hypothetical protein